MLVLVGVSLICFIIFLVINGTLSNITVGCLNKLEKYFKYLFIVFSLQWVILACVNYYSFRFHTWDTASFANPLSNLLQTGNLYNTFLERHAFADHFTPNLLIFYPLFFINNSTLWLTFAKLAAYFACPFLLIKTGRLLKLPPHLVYVAPLLFLFHQYSTNTLLFEFQPSSLSLPFIVLSFNYAIERNYLKTLLVLIVLLGFKEHMALIWVSVGAYILFFQGRTKEGLFFILMGIMIGIFIFYIVMPYFASGLTDMHASRFNPFSLYYEKVKLIFLSFLSVGFIPLLSPKTLLFIIPAFGISLVSQDPNMLTFDYHYHDIAMPVLFVGVVFGLSSINDVNHFFSKKTKDFFLAICISTIFIMNTSFPYQKIRENWPDNQHVEMMQELKQIRQVVEKDAPLWITERFSIYFIDFANLKSIDVWGGVTFESSMWTNVKEQLGKKTVIIPREQVFSSLDPDKYSKLSQKLEFDNGKKCDKNNNFKHFIIYVYK
jgi:uncharacterized membrane protein